MKKRVMILGANGFLGRNLVHFLDTKEDIKQILIDRPPDLFDESVKESWWHNHDVFHADLTEELWTIKDRLKGVDTVINLANKARIEPSWIFYEQYYGLNVSATQKVFSLCQTMGVRRFIQVSSSSVYGNNGTSIQRENDPLEPTNPYAVSKMAGEWALKVQARRGKTELIVVRPFTMYGNFMDYSENALVIAKFISAYEKREPLLLHGGGTQSRDFLHASDAVDGLWRITEQGKNGEVYNLGTGKSVTIKSLADIVSDKQIITPPRIGAIETTCADISKLRKLGFEPKIDVLEWLQTTMKELIMNKIIA